MDYLKDLNPEQREAVLHGDGPLLILAGAGSGKTRVITCRIAHLIRQRGVPPHNILAVTFTNKAADEMRGRVERMLNIPLTGLWISTFHSACVRILRQHADRLGYKKQFVIYDETDRSSLVKTCMKELNIDESIVQPRAVTAAISSLKNNLVDAADYEKQSSGFGFDATVAGIYSLYETRLKEAGALDFDDLLMQTVKLFERHQDVLTYYHGLFRHILIDEYQDTNKAQYRLVRLLTRLHRNLCVVGDDDQSIYRFRGADITNILNFEKDFPDAKVIKLEQNYRSTGNILSAAGAVVARNIGRKPKTLWTERHSGDRILCYKALDEKDEARYVVRTIERLLDEGRSLRDTAVLYRTNAQSRALEDAFRSRGIPYRIFGGLRFYDRKEIKDIIAYLRVLHNPYDIVSLKRIINVPPRGIGDATIERLEQAAAENGSGLYDMLGADVPGVTPNAKRRLKEFLAVMERLRQSISDTPLTELVRRVMHDTGYIEALQQEKTIESRVRIENIDELLTATEDFSEQREDASLAAFLDQVSLITDMDQQAAKAAGNRGADAVTLMTLHNAKGLEFPVVFMIGMEEGLFPHSRSVGNEVELEEERRLCYVGMTRAKDRLFISYALSRRLYGYSQSNYVSRFVEDIPSELMKYDSGNYIPSSAATFMTAGRRAEGNNSEVVRLASRPTKNRGDSAGPSYYKGAVVRHAKFGIGTVQRTEGAGEDLKICVSFPGHGVKTLAVKYANLEKI